MKYDLEERTYKFAANVINFYRSIEIDTFNKNTISQVLRSSASIGANYAEANGASSRKDFKNKINFCRKESKETLYWLNLSKLFNNSKNLDLLISEAKELVLIFNKIGSTLRS